MANEDTHISGMAGRYASALFSLADEHNAVDTVAGHLGTFARLLSESEDLTRLVRSPVFTVEEQEKALSAVLARAGIDGLTANFIKLVASKRRLFALSDMIKGFNALVDSSRGVTRAQVTVAEPLGDLQTNALRDALAQVSGGKSVDIAVKIDPSIIGGLVVKIGSRMLDASLKTKLNSLRTRMKEVG